MARKKSELLSVMGTMFEISKAIVDAVLARGGDDEDVKKILKDRSLADKIAALIVGAVATVGNIFRIVFSPAKFFVYDKTKDGWKLVSDLKYEAGEMELELVEILKSGETSIRGDEMAKRAIELDANSGQKHAEFILKHQDLIPKEWRSSYITFPGTVWQDSDGDRYIPCLDWRGECWFLYFFWLESDWDSNDRILRLRK